MRMPTCSIAECALLSVSQAPVELAHPPKSLCSARALATAPETSALRQSTGWIVEGEEEEQGSEVMGSKQEMQSGGKVKQDEGRWTCTVDSVQNAVDCSRCGRWEGGRGMGGGRVEAG